MKRSVFSLILLWATIGAAWAQPTINLSGGGTGLIRAAIDGNTTTGANLVIQDSLTYTETQLLLIGVRYSAVAGRRSFNISALPGQTPTIVLNNAGMVTYAGSADVKIGSNSGGRITIDARNAAIGGTGGAVWYIGQENDIGAPGQACRLTFENVVLDFRGRLEGIVFGAGGNDDTPQLTSATLALNNVHTRGGGRLIQALYKPGTTPSLVSVANCQLMELGPTADVEAFALHLGAFQLGGAQSKAVVSRTLIHMPDTGTVGWEANGMISRRGTLTVDHSNIVNLSTFPNANGARGILCTEAGITSVTNSIIHASAGVAVLNGNLGAAGSAVDCNIYSPDGVPNAGFNLTNCIAEWPVFEAVNDNPANPLNQLVRFGTLSATHGSTPPLGARLNVSVPPSQARQWSMYQ